MTEAIMAPPVWIEQYDDLYRAANVLRQCSRVGVDTESNSLYVYRERVCLMQITTGEVDYLVDTLALPDLAALAPLFASPQIEKIFHAAEYDLICLKRDFNLHCCNLFDTMQAGRILGRSEVGLGNMLKAEFGVVLDKGCQRANWGTRPLPPRQMEYARLDVHFLLPLRERLGEALETRGLLPLAQEDFRRLCRVETQQSANGVENCLRQSGKSKLLPHQQKVLKELCRYREEYARQADLPPFKVIGAQMLFEISLACPRTLEELLRVQGINYRVAKRHARGLLEAVAAGMNGKLEWHAAAPRPDEGYMERYDILRAWRKQAALALGVESDIVLPRDFIETIARDNPATPEALKSLMQCIPWRYERFGAQILHQLSLNRR